MARVSEWDEKRQGRVVPPPTLPAVNVPDLDIEREAREAAARVAERKTIRGGYPPAPADAIISYRNIGALGNDHEEAGNHDRRYRIDRNALSRRSVLTS